MIKGIGRFVGAGGTSTGDKHSVVIGAYLWPESKTITKIMIGNAVPPEMAKQITQAVLKAA